MRNELVTTLKRSATKLLALLPQLRKDRDPILLTEHGRAAAYLVDVETFERMQERMRVLEGIARGEKAVREGRTVSHAQARKRMKKWLE